MTTSHDKHDPEAKAKQLENTVHQVSDSVNEASHNISDKVNDSMTEVKSFYQENMDHAKELTSAARNSIRTIGKRVYQSVKTTVTPVIQTFDQAESDEGTALRKGIQNARLSVNEKLHEAQLKLNETKSAADESLEPMKGSLVYMKRSMIKMDEFRREYPELAVVGLAVVLGVPSLVLRGKFAALKNVTIGLGLATGAVFIKDHLDEQKKL